MNTGSSLAPPAAAARPSTAARPLWQTYLSILLPMMATNVLQAVAGTVDGIYLGRMLGVDALAAVSAFFPVFFLLLAAILGLGAITRTGLWFNLAATGGCVALVYLVARAVIGWSITDPAVIDLAVGLLHLVAWTMVQRGASLVLGGVMRASGTVLAPALLGLAAVAGLLLPLAQTLDGRVGLPGIWWAQAATFTVMPGLQAAYYLGFCGAGACRD